MHTVIDGLFVQEGSYYGPREAFQRQQLTDMLAAMFPKGAMLQISLTVDQVGMRSLCDKPTKYGICGDVLAADGTCKATNHVEPEPEPEPELEAVEA